MHFSHLTFSLPISQILQIRIAQVNGYVMDLFLWFYGGHCSCFVQLGAIQNQSYCFALRGTQ